MKQEIDLNWLIENDFVRQVDKDVLPNLTKFTFVTFIEVPDKLKVFFYTAEIDGDLLVAQRESYYIESKDEFIHANKIRVFKSMKAWQFSQLIQQNSKSDITNFTNKEQDLLTSLDAKRDN